MSIEAQDIEKIKERIAKLMRMAKDSASPNEAAIAAGRARKLMDQYQLDEFDVDNSQANDFATEGATGYMDTFPQYVRFFVVAVAKYNDCQARMEPRGNGDGHRMVFSGYKNDVDLAKAMFDQLQFAIVRLCKEYLLGLGYSDYQPKLGTAFKNGAFDTLVNRLHHMTIEREALMYKSTGTALMVVKEKAVTEHFGDPGYTSARKMDPKTMAEQHARLAGKVQGDKIEIRKTVTE